MRVEEGLEDLFDLLDIVEADDMELRARGPRSRRDRERWEMEVEDLEGVRATGPGTSTRARNPGRPRPYLVSTGMCGRGA